MVVARMLESKSVIRSTVLEPVQMTLNSFIQKKRVRREGLEKHPACITHQALTSYTVISTSPFSDSGGSGGMPAMYACLTHSRSLKGGIKLRFPAVHGPRSW
jgi:hypothetical protein